MPAERTRSTKRADKRAGNPLSRAPAPVTISFAPTITPGTFFDPPSPIDDAPLSESMLFPPSPDVPNTSKRSNHTKKKPEDHIPRPPNAFILFRSSFIKNNHVSADVETNHSTLSKIIGYTWQNLPNDEKEVWHRKAKVALDEHKKKFPRYTFRPTQPKTQAPEKRKVREVGPKDLTRCKKIAELLVEGLKGEDLEKAVAQFDAEHVPEIVTRFEAPITARAFRRSSSAPVEETEHSKPSFLVSSPRRKKARASSTQPEVPSPSPSLESPIADSPSLTFWSPSPSERGTDAGSVYSYESAPASPCDASSEYGFANAHFDFSGFTFTDASQTSVEQAVDPLCPPQQDSAYDLYSAFCPQPAQGVSSAQSPAGEDVFGPCVPLTVDTSVATYAYSASPSPMSSIPSSPLESHRICAPVYGADTGMATAVADLGSPYGFFPTPANYNAELTSPYTTSNDRSIPYTDYYQSPKCDIDPYFTKTSGASFGNGLDASYYGL